MLLIKQPLAGESDSLSLFLLLLFDICDDCVEDIFHFSQIHHHVDTDDFWDANNFSIWTFRVQFVSNA